MNTVDVVVDLRKRQSATTEPGEILALWKEIEPAISGTSRAAGSAIRVTLGSDEVSVVFVSGSVVAGQPVAFRLQGLIERPRFARPCRICAADGVVSAGEFQCKACKSAASSAGVCSRHVCVLDGAYTRKQLQVSCLEHAPKCHDCDAKAQFWCQGQACKGERAWCRTHRKSHRNSPETGYCAQCYELAFPQCAIANCQEPGVNICEHVDARLETLCGVKLCNRHVARWQVFGYERIGLGRCRAHRMITALNDQEVIFQVVAGAAWRHLNPGTGADRYFLPTLGSVKNILIKGRNQFYDENAALTLYQSMLNKLKAQRDTPSAVRAKMLNLLERASGNWLKRVNEAEARRAQGETYFQALRGVLTRRGEVQLAQSITMSDFVPHFGRGDKPVAKLFVRVPNELKGRFIGTRGANIQAFGTAIGCLIGTEREDRK